jgi:AcrR family transcriptional regulator
MSDAIEYEVPEDLVQAAIREARRRREDVADIPVTALADAAGVSRSTLLRRIGGSRRALDDAIRAAGVDPGGRRPVRERAIEAGARLISDRGSGGVTLEAVAAASECSVHSVYAAFGGRDQLMAAIYQRYSPIAALASLTTEPPGSLEETVNQVYRALADSLSREPRVLPAMLADLFSRPDSLAGGVFRRYFPLALDRIGGWLGQEIQAGRIRPLPPLLLMEQLLGPLTMHLLLRPAMEQTSAVELPDIEDACTAFTEAFLRAAAVPDTKGAASCRPRDAGSGS